MKVYIFWKFLQYTIHLDKIQMWKKFPLDKINFTKNALFFLSRAPTHHSFTFNSRFSYELKHNAHLSKKVSVGFFIFNSLSFLLWLSINSLTLKRHSSFQNYNNNKAMHSFAPRPLWFLSCDKKFEISIISAWVGATEKLTWRRIFRLRKSKLWVRQFFQIVTLK